MRDAVVSLAHDRGLAMVVESGRLAGVLTTGRPHPPGRAGSRRSSTWPVSGVMTRTPRTAAPDELAAAAVGTMERHGVIALPVVESDGRVAGAVHLHDLMRAGAV